MIYIYIICDIYDSDIYYLYMKMWYIYHIEIYNGILLSHKKEWNFVICSNMDRLGGYYTKRTKSDRERQIL